MQYMEEARGAMAMEEAGSAVHKEGERREWRRGNDGNGREEIGEQLRRKIGEENRSWMWR